MIFQVHFAAINCWNPGSECRLQHNKIPSWPILVAYTVTSRGVLYKGETEDYYITFLTYQNPINYIKFVFLTQSHTQLLKQSGSMDLDGYVIIELTTKY